MFLSYLVTCHNETDSLEKLLSKLIEYKKDNHEIVLLDDYSDNPKTLEIIQTFKDKINFQQHKLDKNYGNHKNYGIDLCKGEWIFQLDADEVPTDGLLENIDLIIESNSKNEVLWLPRLNYFIGVTEQDVNTWGWNCNTFKDLIHEKLIDDTSDEYKFLKNKGLILEEHKIN
jgi:glycosyltransferase involved in cell wall biosynthesis